VSKFGCNVLRFVTGVENENIMMRIVHSLICTTFRSYFTVSTSRVSSAPQTLEDVQMLSLETRQVTGSVTVRKFIREVVWRSGGMD